MIELLFLNEEDINMVVNIDHSKLSQNKYSEWINDVKYVWDVPTLIEHAKDNKYEEFDLPLAGISFDYLPWKMLDVIDYAKHYKRVKKANLDYPILLTDRGVICDGWHRICKALVEGRETIKAIRLQEMPEAHREEVG